MSTDKNNEGLSLFGGTGSISVGNDDEQEDEVDLEDQKKRQEELQNLIASAFDDIPYEDEQSTVNTSYDSTNSKYRSDLQDVTNGNQRDSHAYTDIHYKNTSFNSANQLQVLYQIRVQEVKDLNAQLDVLKAEMKSEHDTSEKKRFLLEADCKRTSLLLEQSQKLLMEKNDELNTKTKEIIQLKELVDVLEEAKEKNDEEIDQWKTEVNDLQQRLQLLEKGLHTTVSEKTIRNHYEKEIHELQSALHSSASKLERAERECQGLHSTIQEAERAREIILAEKAEIINSMTKSLEDSQAHCYALLSKISSLQAEKQSLRTELDVLKETAYTKNKVSQKQQDELVNTLRDELKRSLEEQTQKRNEITKLETIVKRLVENERKLKEEHREEIDAKTRENLVAAEQLRSETSRVLQDNSVLRERIQELEALNRQLTEAQLVQSIKNLSSESIQPDTMSKEDYDKLKQEVTRLENQLEETKAWKARCILCEEQCLKLQETVAQMNSKLSESQVTISTLQEKLLLKEERDSLIEVLQKKAAMFEDYMANRPPEVVQEDKAVCTSDIPELQTQRQSTSSVSNNRSRESREKAKQALNEKLTDLEKTVVEKAIQFQALLQENKNLKEKLVFDRNAFSEFGSVWVQESKKLNEALSAMSERNDILIAKINELIIENKEKDLQYSKLNTKYVEASDFIKLMKAVSKHQEDHLSSEYERISKKFQDLLETVQKRMNKCLNLNDAILS